MGLAGYNKGFLAATVNTPGSTRGARLLRHTDVFQGILNGDVLPDKTINLGMKYGIYPCDNRGLSVS